MARFRSGALTCVALASFFAISACGDQEQNELLAPVSAASHASSTVGAVLVECPANTTISASGTIGTIGGSVALRGHRLEVPLLGITTPRSFELAAPASNYMELRVRAGGLESFRFNKPATIVIDYSRCSRSNIEKGPLTVWQIDPETKELLEHMGGVDDKEARTVTFQTDHLSTFSIAH